MLVAAGAERRALWDVHARRRHLKPFGVLLAHDGGDAVPPRVVRDEPLLLLVAVLHGRHRRRKVRRIRQRGRREGRACRGRKTYGGQDVHHSFSAL